MILLLFLDGCWLICHSFFRLPPGIESLPEGPEKEEIVKRRAKDGGPLMGALLGGNTCSPLLPYLVKLCMDNDKTPFVESLISLDLGSLKWRQSKS